MISFGFISYLLIKYAVFGDAFAFLEVQRAHWFKHFAAPWEGLAGALGGILWRNPAEKVIVGGAELVFRLFCLVCIIYALSPNYAPRTPFISSTHGFQ